MNAAVLRGPEAFAELGDAWDDRVRSNPHAAVFQAAAWYRAWIEAVAGAEGASPLVVRVPADGPLRAALALQECLDADGRALLTPLSAPWADYHEVAADAWDGDALDALGRALADLVRRSGRSLVVNEAREGGLLDRLLTRVGAKSAISSWVGSVSLTAERLGALLSVPSEYALKERRLQRLGDLQCVHLSDADAIREALPHFIEMHRRQWQDRADAVAPFDGGVIDAAFFAFARHLAPGGQVLLTDLRLGQRSVAMYFGFVHAGAYLAYRTTFDPELRRLSPGHVMLRRMLVDFRARGLHTLDLMRGGYAYKQAYTDVAGRNRRLVLEPA